MKLHPRRTAALLALPGLAFAMLAGVPAAHATTPPPWDPDANANGTITFYDASGQVVTSGTDLAHFADYAAASSSASPANASKATLYFYTPVSGQPTGNWQGAQSGAATTFPNAAYPAPLTGPGFTKPVAKIDPLDGNLTDYVASYPNTDTTTAGFLNTYQVRLVNGGPGIVTDGRYWETNLVIDTVAGTWTQIVSGPAGTAPTLNVAPSISGTAKVGGSVTCAGASFTGATSVTYGWTSNGATIGGATSSKLTLGASLYNKTVACRATGTNTYGSTPSTSSGKKVALGAALKVTKKPTLSGTFKYNKTVKVAHGSWSPSGTSYSYQWKLDGKSIKKATKSSYKIPKKAKGHKLTCVVTAKRAGYANGSATTAYKKVAK